VKVANTNTPTMLAKLLAKENINVIVGNYNTAFFDVKNRTLGLPTWNTDSKFVSDLLVGHEVGHALHTPSDAISRFHEKIPGAPFAIGNVVEDIRIERMVRDNYPGLIYSFREGYKHFIEKDFFKLNNKDLTKFGFIDRLNLKGKIGNLMDIPLSAEEEVLYNRCLAAESYDEVLEICKDIYEFVGAEKEKNKENQSQGEDTSEDEDESQDEGEQSVGGDSEEQDGSEETNSDASDASKEQKSEADGDADGDAAGDGDEDGNASDADSDDSSTDSTKECSKIDDQSTTPGSSKGKDSFKPNYSDDTDPFESLTQNEFESNLKDLQKNIDYSIINAPKKEQIMNVVVPVDKVMHARQTCPFYNTCLTNPEFTAHYAQFKTSTKKHIAVLIKEFERRKSAFQYSRSRESASGSINVNKLHSYKFEDQIFKSVTSLADAKSHGMVFFIDYSGSMRYTLEDVIDQTLQLVYFCKAVGIPFEVYGFTGPDDLSAYHSERTSSCNSSTPFGLNIRLDDSTHIFQLLNSDMKKDKFELSVRELKAQVFNFNSNARCNFNMPTLYEKMSSTPLMETIIVAHDIVKTFKAKHKIQKMNTVFLTDGDGSRLMLYDNSSDSQFRKKSINTVTYTPSYMINVHGREINFTQSSSYYDNNGSLKKLYSDLIENLKITCGTTVLGFFVAQNQRDLKTNGIDSFIYNSNNKESLSWAAASEKFKTETKKNKKEKCLLVKGAFNYDAYFIFENKKNLNIAEENSFESDSISSGKSFTESSVQTKLAKDFTKFASEKRTSRVFLNKFAEIIA